VVQLEKYFDFSLYSHHFSLLSLTSLLSAPEREVPSPSDFKVVGALRQVMVKAHITFGKVRNFKRSADGELKMVVQLNDQNLEHIGDITRRTETFSKVSMVIKI
jgi:hypothetical protein